MTAGLGLPGALILVFLLGWIVGRARNFAQRMDAGMAWTAAAEASARADLADQMIVVVRRQLADERAKHGEL